MQVLVGQEASGVDIEVFDGRVPHFADVILSPHLAPERDLCLDDRRRY